MAKITMQVVANDLIARKKAELSTDLFAGGMIASRKEAHNRPMTNWGDQVGIPRRAMIPCVFTLQMPPMKA